MNPTPEEIARSLSPAQREAVLRCDGWKPAFMLSIDNRGGQVAGEIKRSGLFDKKMGGAQNLIYRLNEMGLAVRRTLAQGTPEQDG